ncbi:MAG TPA: hypothetical protein VK158_02535 [Acidobacteriota bacterium]|nr:hypothetical protein [Acidobacteriota bacterium]
MQNRMLRYSMRTLNSILLCTSIVVGAADNQSQSPQETQQSKMRKYIGERFSYRPPVVHVVQENTQSNTGNDAPDAPEPLLFENSLNTPANPLLNPSNQYSSLGLLRFPSSVSSIPARSAVHASNAQPLSAPSNTDLKRERIVEPIMYVKPINRASDWIPYVLDKAGLQATARAIDEGIGPRMFNSDSASMGMKFSSTRASLILRNEGHNKVMLSYKPAAQLLEFQVINHDKNGSHGISARAEKKYDRTSKSDVSDTGIYYAIQGDIKFGVEKLSNVIFPLKYLLHESDTQNLPLRKDNQ